MVAPPTAATCAELPQWVVAKLGGSVERTGNGPWQQDANTWRRGDTSYTIEGSCVEVSTPGKCWSYFLDTASAVAEARRYMGGQEEKVDQCYTHMCMFRDLGLSREQAVALAVEYGADEGHARERVDNAWNYAQNPPGEKTTNAKFGLRGASTEQQGEPLGDPVDILGTITVQPELHRDMLPDTEAMAYAFDVAERQGVDPVLTVTAMLATCAAAIHDGIKLQRKQADTEHQERAHVNILVVAPPGAGKSPAREAMTRPLKDIEDRWRHEDAAGVRIFKATLPIYEQQKKQFLARIRQATDNDPDAWSQNMPPEPEKPIERRLVANDVTIEGLQDVLKDNPRGVLNEQDEMSGFIAGFDAYRNGKSGKDRAFWLQTDNGGSYSVDRAGDRKYFIPNLSCCFIGGIQPNRLREIAADLTDDGFIQRAFVIHAEGGFSEVDREPNEAARQAYTRLLDGLVALQPPTPPAPIKLDWDAHPIREEVERVAAAMMVLPTTPAALCEHLAKWKGKFIRTLLLFHVIECVSRGEMIDSHVSGETAKRARDFMVRFVLPHAVRFYDEFFRANDAALTDARWIAGHILAHKLEKITGRDVAQAYFPEKKKNDDRLFAAMAILTNANWLRVPVTERNGQSVVWTVNTRVHTRFAALAEREATRRTAIRQRIADAAAELELQEIA